MDDTSWNSVLTKIKRTEPVALALNDEEFKADLEEGGITGREQRDAMATFRLKKENKGILFYSPSILYRPYSIRLLFCSPSRDANHYLSYHHYYVLWSYG